MGDTTHIFRTFASKVLYSLISLATGVITARILGPSGKGEYTIVLLLSSMVASLGSLNLGETAIYFHNKKGTKLGTIILSNAVFILVSNSIYLLILIFLWKHDALPWKEFSASFMFFSCLLVPIILFQNHVVDILRCIRRYDAYNILLLLQPVIYLLFVILFVYFLNLYVIGAILSSSISFLFLIALGIIFIFHKSQIDLKCDSSYLKSGLAYGIKGHVGSVLQKFNLRLDQFIITPYWGSAMLGYYSVALILPELIWYIPDSIGVVTLPKIAGSNKNDAETITTKSLRITLALTLAAIGILFVIAEPGVLILYGDAFRPAIRAIYFLLPGIFFMSISKILSKYFSGMGLPEINSYTSAISCAVTVILCIVLIPKYAIVGAAIASSSAYAIRAICDVAFFIKESRCALVELIVFTREDLNYLRQLRQIVK